jgi:GT2 family glycosyltransferase
VEKFLEGLCSIVRTEDPKALVTYVNYPTTEYLRLGFADFLCLNVYLENRESLTRYISRLQNLADDKPLVLGELGLDSIRNGQDFQATTLDWQIRAAFAGGCAGVCVFSWTDEWFRGGNEIVDWDFGITGRTRNPKPALKAVSGAFSAAPFPEDIDWPSITVVVCTYNGARHIRQTCLALEQLDYPRFDVVIVCDGSTDSTLAVIAEFDFNVIAVANGGLSRARNLGMENATGDIVAYLDDDAYPDVDWLKYLAWSFLASAHAGIGGPNLPPPEDGFWARCVAHSPGGPNHVLLTDDVAEHIPGCNMAFRKSALTSVGGFDPTFRIAGDDVDICWRLQESGYTLGFNPGAVVWHHRRNSPGAYLRQQYNYGRAEGMLSRKWPEKFNGAGHVRWGGRLYGTGRLASILRPRYAIYHGTWGKAPFQSMYRQTGSIVSSLPMMPEWHILTILLAATTLLGFAWPVCFFAAVLLIPVVGASIVQSVRGAMAAPDDDSGFRARLATGLLHFLQPISRLRGRLTEGVVPGRAPRVPFALASFRSREIWHDRWLPADQRLEILENGVTSRGARAVRGGDFDAWDLDVFGGTAGAVRVLTAIEEHGSGSQLVRYRIIPRFTSTTRAALGVIGILMVGAAVLRFPLAEFGLALAGLMISARAMIQSASAAAAVKQSAEVTV